jgi:hypothetical protein
VNPKPILLVVLSSSIALAGDPVPVRGVCVDGDSERAFVVSEAIPGNALEGGHAPVVDYTEDGKTPKAITWTGSPETRPKVTVIGRFKGHEIIEITFTEAVGAAASFPRPFHAKLLAYRTDAAVSSPLVPFFIVTGEQVRWYEQVFTSDSNAPFGLEVSKTMQGSGVIGTDFTFKFSDSGAWIDQLSSGGRGHKTTTIKFKPDGSVISSEERDGG